MHTVGTYTHETHPDRLRPDQRIRLVYDEHYETRGSYGYDTEEETKAAEDSEIERLESGEWAVYGRIEETRCPACGGWGTTDSLWGIVVENTEKGCIEAAFDV